MPRSTEALSGADSAVSAPPPPPGAAPPTSHPLGSRTKSMYRATPNEDQSTTSTPSQRRPKQREIVVLPAPPSSTVTSHPQSHPANPLRVVNSNGSIDSVSSTATGGKKLSKWLSRTKSSDGQPSLVPATNPTISISPSSSAQSNLSSSSGASRGSGKLQKRRGSADSKTSTSTNHSGSAIARGFANLTLKGNRRGSRQGQEELGEWASADMEEEEGEEDYGRGDGRSVKSLGGRFSLRRSKSNLRMFGRGGKGDEERDLSPTGAPAGRSRSRDSDAHSFSSNSLYSTGNTPLASASHDSTSLYDITSPPLSTAINGNPLSQSQGPAAATAAAAGRIGGWFNSILHSSSGPGGSSSSSNLPLSSSPLTDPPSSSGRHSSFNPAPSDSTSNSAGSPSKFSLGSAGSFRLGGGGGGSPKKGSAGAANGNGATGGRLGPLDRMLDKAVQYFLDTDSQADRCEEDIWVLGVRHEGWRPEGGATGEDGDERDELEGQQGRREKQLKEGKRRSWQNGKGKRGGSKKKRASVDLDSLSASSTGSIPSSSSANTSPDLDARSSSRSPSPSATSSDALATSPLPPTTFGWPLAFYHDFYSRIALTYRTGFPAIPCSPSSGGGGMMNALSMSIGRGGARGGSAEGLTTDSGWGCMLRTGQSLLANTLVTVHLGRDWRRTLSPSASSTSPANPTPVAATYTRILSLFLDDPSPLSPFSVHRFALMGKQLGKDVGEWFGPSTAAGAIKALVNAFEPAGLKVVVVNDGAVYRSEVAAAARGERGTWEKPVLVLIGLRLGIDGVNPIYHEAVKGIFQLPQSVGIAGGRPSSSYYFVGAQANSLFYIDPHHPRIAIPLRPPASSEVAALAQQIPISLHPSSSPEEREQHHRESTITDSFITVAPPAPSTPTTSRRTSPPAISASRRAPASEPPAERVLLDEYFTEAYSDQQTRSYHCEKVRKMALASLDPSMLVGFLIKDEDDWEHFSEKVTELFQTSKPIFSLADSPPSWMRRTSGTGAPFSTTDATPTRAPHSTATPSFVGEDDTDDFSEPEDWELESTDASAASSSVAVPLPGNRADEAGHGEEEEVQSIRRVDPTSSSWYSATSASLSPADTTSSTSATSAVRAFPAPSTPVTPYPLRSPDDESLVVVDPVPRPSSSPIVIAESESEEGWEGVSPSPPSHP